MTKEQILERVRSSMARLFELDADEIQLESRLYQDLELDSIDAIDLVVELQNLTGRKIKPEEFKQVRTVEDVVNAIQTLLRSDG